MKMRNFTGHQINFGDEVIHPEGLVQVLEETKLIFWAEVGRTQVPIMKKIYHGTQGLPDPQPDVLLCVSSIVANENKHREDLVCPITKKRGNKLVAIGFRKENGE